MNSQTPNPPNAHPPKRALIVFARPPVAGEVKTRLTTLLSEKDAARLYEAFLQDALAQYADLDAVVRLYHTPPTGAMEAHDFPEGVTAHVQRGEGLGDRMRAAFEETFAAGYHRVVIVGTDHPTLPSRFVERAFEALDGEDAVCIGPSADGGYYLLGMCRPHPQLFVRMTFSHADVLEETLARAGRAEAQVTIVPEWYDVDTPGDLRRLRGDLKDGKAARAPQTRAVMDELSGTYPSLRPQTR